MNKENNSDFIQKYLSRFSGEIEKTRNRKKEIADIIKKYSQISLENNQIDEYDGVLTLSLKPIERNQIEMKKEKILEELRALKIFQIK